MPRRRCWLVTGDQRCPAWQTGAPGWMGLGCSAEVVHAFKQESSYLHAIKHKMETGSQSKLSSWCGNCSLASASQMSVSITNPKMFKWLFGRVGSPSEGTGGRHKAPVAMVVQQEQGCILAPEPNATLIFSLANLHSLFTACLFLSQALLSVSVWLLPISHASLWPAAFWEAKDTVKRKNRPWDGSLSSQWPTLNS